MIIRAGYNIAFQCFQETPINLLLSVHPSRAQHVIGEHVIKFSPDVPSHDFTDMNVCAMPLKTAHVVPDRKKSLPSSSVKRVRRCSTGNRCNDDLS